MDNGIEKLINGILQPQGASPKGDLEGNSSKGSVRIG